MTDRVEITRAHTWRESDFAYWKKLIDRYGIGKLDEKSLKQIHGAGSNLDYMRVYIPLGSRLVGMEGVEAETVRMYEELGYTVISFLFGPVAPGELQTVKISYRLPGKTDPSARKGMYRFIARKQAGADNVTLKKSIRTAEDLRITEIYPPAQESPFAIYPTVASVFDANKIFLAAWARE
jgi:hypothetical protein